MTLKPRIARIGLLALAPVLLLAVVSCQGFFVTPKLTAIQVNPQSSTVPVGGTLQLSVVGVNNDGTAATTLGPVSFSTSDPQVATVSANGIVTGVSAGTATISAASTGVTGSTTVTVGSSAPPAGLIIAPAGETVSLATGFVQFNAASNNQDVTASCTWTSSDTAVAQFNPLTPGSATLVGQGPTTITANCNASGSGTTSLTVGP